MTNPAYLRKLIRRWALKQVRARKAEWLRYLVQRLETERELDGKS